MERKDDADYVKTYTRLLVEGKAPVGRPKKARQNIVCRNASAESCVSYPAHE